jgi:hypothetical protein
VATFETGLFDREGVRRDDFLLSDLFGAHYAGVTRSSMTSDEAGYKQVYMKLVNAHPILDGMAGTSVLPMGGDYCVVAQAAGTEMPLTLSAPFIVFPEGFSYPKISASDDPLALIRTPEGGGRTVYFPGQLGSLAWTVPYPDLQRLIADTVAWAAGGELPLQVAGPPTLQVSLRKQHDPERRLVHLINLTGGERFFSELVELHDVTITLPVEDGYTAARALMLSDGEALPVTAGDGFWEVTVPVIHDYDVLVIELGEA